MNLPSSVSKEFSRTLIFTATYNELENIEDLLSDIWCAMPNTDVLVIDDNSQDGTGGMLDKIASKNPLLKTIHRPEKLGLGMAHHFAMIYAIKQGYDALVTMDADHSHNPQDIPSLLQKLSDADFVIGSRYMSGGSCDYTGYRRFVSVSATIGARMLLGIPLHEFTTSFRAFRLKELRKVNFIKLHNHGYSFFMESIFRLKQAGLRLMETPIHFDDRKAGVSKIPRFEILRGIWKLFCLTISRLFNHRDPVSLSLINEKCSNCSSVYLSEQFPQQLKPIPEDDRSSSFRCSSMAHTSKPRIAKCLQCGFSQVPYSEHPSDLEDLYMDVIDEDYLNNLHAKKKTFAHCFKRIQRFLPPPGKLVEVGSYCGLFLKEAQSHGWIVNGIEPSHWAAEYARSTFGLNIIKGTLEKIVSTPMEENDVVVCWDVLEHVRNPKEFLSLMSKLLKPGGILALSTIDIDAWFPRLLGKQWPWILEMHLNYFGSGSLNQMFDEAGFDLVCVEPYRHYSSLRYAYRKFCALFPEKLEKTLSKIGKLMPEITLPVSLGDIKLYVGKKR
ncbi:MAG: methyltransferase domain-containing protein [Nitrospirae bacterium]|nr:methyltransferase domain-containing protein [Nitrospirota bacterium]